MKANELRIGNKFECMGMVQTVFELCDNTDRGRIKQAGYEYIITCEENGNQYKPIEIKPIKLTENWLIKFGLEEGHVGYYHIGEFIISVEGQVYFGETETWIAEIHFAHQLQNLYYALTGEELSLSGI